MPVSPLPQNRHTDASGLMCSAQYGQTFVRPLRTDAASSICRFEGRTRIQISPKIPSRHPTKNQPTPLRPFSEATTAQGLAVPLSRSPHLQSHAKREKFPDQLAEDNDNAQNNRGDAAITFHPLDNVDENPNTQNQ